MSRAQGLMMPLELAYSRRGLFALELLDAVSLDRVYQGVSVVAEGLQGKPVLNSSGMYVWLEEDFSRLKRLVIEPGLRPYERVELKPSQVAQPLTTVELAPRVEYPFATGATGLRGTLVESQPLALRTAKPVAGAQVRMWWLDEDGAWRDGRISVRTGARGGDFASVLRLAAVDQPTLDEAGQMTVRVRVSRAGASDRRSEDLKVLPGRVKGPPSAEPIQLAWDRLVPAGLT
jgi:hypothetical protein